MIKVTTFALLLILVASTSLYAQDTVFISKKDKWSEESTSSYKTDTVIFPTPMKRHILIGTTILEYSPKVEQAKGYGYNLQSISAKPCMQEKERPEYVYKVNSISRSDTVWNVALQATENCCYSFLGEIEIVNDSILNLVYHGYGSYCFCTCDFMLEYRINREPFINDKDVTHVIINGKKETLTAID